MTANRLVVDLHLHSRYSMATSPQLNIASISETAAWKGIDLVAAPDFTHPGWREEMRNALEPSGEGVFRARSGAPHGPQFVLVTEIACIWRWPGEGKTGSRSRRGHVLLMAPSFEAADRISAQLAKYQRLESDGRPMIKLSAEDLYSLALAADARCVLFPAHVWTPWYGVYGSKSGFDRLQDCFGEHTDRVPAIETGLSSDPFMNWGVSDIGDRAIVSFSDAHSAATIGRELTVLDATASYESVRYALFENRVLETIEFHPEHGKYHLDGHRKCRVRLAPSETPADGRCPVCRKPLTLGVMHRVAELSDRNVEEPVLRDGLLYGTTPEQKPFRKLVPLRELVAGALRSGVSTKKVSQACDSLVEACGNELAVLTTATGEQIADVAGRLIAHAIQAVRYGNVTVEPGFDGVYGVVTPRLHPD
jgi:DNA helicase-2/ATP-dependent DNA helicase PcrA